MHVGVGLCSVGATCVSLFFEVFFTGVSVPVWLAARFPGTEGVGELEDICTNVGCCSAPGGEGGMGNSAFRSASNKYRNKETY